MHFIMMVATMAIQLSLLVQPTNASELSQTIYLATNEVQNVDYPGCMCDFGQSCDSCKDYSVIVSCKGCRGVYFKDNPAHR